MIRVAIVGTGSISQEHIKGYLQFPDRVRIVALADIYPEKAEEKKQRYKLTEAEVEGMQRRGIHFCSRRLGPWAYIWYVQRAY